MEIPCLSLFKGESEEIKKLVKLLSDSTECTIKDQYATQYESSKLMISNAVIDVGRKTMVHMYKLRSRVLHHC